ncbi:hypothetical protein TWF718_000091 [Orbilia javanica]|uniref:Lysine-specific metallo-endopeptidase domain-containing protein n=1 Tax=Orbilia javanica TaxID=47235 RepID=A0AAN8MZ41_9PEZI
MHLLNSILTFLMIFGFAVNLATSAELEDVFTIVRDGPGACSEKEADNINLYHMDVVSMLEAGLELFRDVLGRGILEDNGDLRLRQMGARLMFESWFGIQFTDRYKGRWENIYQVPVDPNSFLFIHGKYRQLSPNILSAALNLVSYNKPLKHLNGVKPKIYCNDEWMSYATNTNFDSATRGCGNPRLLGFTGWRLSAITLCAQSFYVLPCSNLRRGDPPGPTDPMNAPEDHYSGSMLFLHEILHLVLGPDDRRGRQVELYTSGDCRLAVLQQITPILFEAKRNPQSYVWFMQGAYFAQQARSTSGIYYEYSTGRPRYITVVSSDGV